MDFSALNLAYGACAILVVAYAWERFNTPSSNRSSTRRTLYWSSCAGYVFTAVALYAALSGLLQIPSWRKVLLEEADMSLPAPLIATIVMTTLLSSVPMLKKLDDWILSFFLDWGAIPAELKRRAATMTAKKFVVTADDVARLRESYGDNSYGPTLDEHLRVAATEGIELSQYRLTQVVKIFDCLKGLEGEDRYASFFAGSAEQFKDIETRMATFLRQSDNSLTLAVKLRSMEGQEAYEELMRERREAFAQSCRTMFNDLALFLAAAVLRSERTEKDIVRRLRSLGFLGAEPLSEPVFPIHALTLLAFGLFVYLATLTIFFAHLNNVPHQQGNPMVATSKVFLTRIVAIGVVVWLMQNYPFFRREPGEPRKYFAYALCGAISTIAATVVCVPYALAGSQPFLTELYNSFPPVFLSGILCVAVAFCCDDWPEDNPDESAAPLWLRFAEGLRCGAVMMFGTSLLFFGDLLPPSMTSTLSGFMVFAWIILPPIMGVMIGAFVPHIYRSARRAAVAKRGEALRGDSSAHGLPLQLRGPRTVGMSQA